MKLESEVEYRVLLQMLMLKLRGSATETWLINNDRDRYGRRTPTARIGKNELNSKSWNLIH